MVLWVDSGLFVSIEDDEVRYFRLGVSSVIHWRYKCGVAINLHYDHDVFVSLLGMEGKAASLVLVRFLFCFVKFEVYISCSFSLGCCDIFPGSVADLGLVERNCFGDLFRCPFGVSSVSR